MNELLKPAPSSMGLGPKELGCFANNPLDMGPSIGGDPKLLKEGWIRRHLISPERVEESRELYTGMGYEVLVTQPRPSDFGTQCSACTLVGCKDYVMIYTRKKA